MTKLNLYLFYVGYKIKGKHNIEQHDICFGVGEQVTDCKQQILDAFPDIPNLHVDTYTLIDQVDDYGIHIIPSNQIPDVVGDIVMEKDLFFINLGGYKPGSIEEVHQKIFMVLSSINHIKPIAEELPFYSEMFLGNKDALPHVDDQLSVEDVIVVRQLIPSDYKLIITRCPDVPDYKTKVTITGFWRLAKWGE